jgi:hypothetical protein
LWLFFLSLHLRKITPFFLMRQALFDGANPGKSREISQSLDLGAFEATIQRSLAILQ